MSNMSPEAKFGIRGAGRYGAKALSQRFALLAGLVYVGIGIVGFAVTGFNDTVGVNQEALLGLFYLNPFHNVVHIIVGALWLLGGLVLSREGTEGLNISIGGFYLLAAVLGFLGYLDLINVRPALDPDNFLHLVSGVLPLVFGSGLLEGSRSAAAAA